MNDYVRGFFTGWWLTAILAVVAASGRIVVPLTVQYALDHALLADDEADRTKVLVNSVSVGAAAVAVAGIASCFLNRRLVATVEGVLAGVRERAFEHIFRLSPAAVTRIGREHSSHGSPVTSTRSRSSPVPAESRWSSTSLRWQSL